MSGKDNQKQRKKDFVEREYRKTGMIPATKEVNRGRRWGFKSVKIFQRGSTFKKRYSRLKRRVMSPDMFEEGFGSHFCLLWYTPRLWCIAKIITKANGISTFKKIYFAHIKEISIYCNARVIDDRYSLPKTNIKEPGKNSSLETCCIETAFYRVVHTAFTYSETVVSTPQSETCGITSSGNFIYWTIHFDI